MWLNVEKHFDGDHSCCMPHRPTDRWSGIDVGNNRELLRAFLKKTSGLLYKCDTRHSTQMCESLHAVKAHFANKLYSWKTSWAPRICAAILTVNESDWAFQLYNRLALPPLDPKIRNEITLRQRERQRENERRRSEIYRKERNRRRREARVQEERDNEKSLYKGLQTRRSMPRLAGSSKRTYRVRKMPGKLGSVNPWFLRMGFKGTAEDDEEVVGMEEYNEGDECDTEEESYSEYSWREEDLQDIRECLNEADAVVGLDDEQLVETAEEEEEGYSE